jgi:hypothetical protein
MRAVPSIVTLALDVILMAVCGAAEFPYAAYVNEPETYVRSGPGNQHYATGQAPAGYAVEVYRHDGEGWCAIRPPEGSFSLAPAHQLRILDSRTAEVTASGVVARVGSSLGEQRNAVQVLLERGEIVQLVEQPVPGQPWVKIAPPAGEFRWIASRRLSRTPPVEGSSSSSGNWVRRSESASGAQSTQQPTPVNGAKDTKGNESNQSDPNGFAHLQISPPGQTAAPLPANPAWLPSANIVGSATDAPTPAPALPSNDIEIVAGSPAEVRLAQYQEPVNPAAEAAGSAQSGPGQSVAKSGSPRIRFNSAAADPRIAEMQIRLSQIVVQPPASWQLGTLREETASLLAKEQTPAVRDQLRDLLDRIATFEAVQSRYRGAAAAPATASTASVASVPAPGMQSGASGLTGQSGEVLARVRSDLGVDNTITPTPGSAPPIAAAGPPAATQALYDAVGTLKPVVSRRDKAPRYALVDDHGDVVTFVTAAADVNLQPYVGKRIGVRGPRGFMPEYRRAHVTASRVTPLEEKLVR